MKIEGKPCIRGTKIEISQSPDKIFPRGLFCCKGLLIFRETSKNERSSISLDPDRRTNSLATPPRAPLSVTVFIWKMAQIRHDLGGLVDTLWICVGCSDKTAPEGQNR